MTKLGLGLLVAVIVMLAVFGQTGTTVCYAQGVSLDGGEPFSMQAVMDDMQRKFKAGGLTMWFLLFLSILGLAFVLERVFRLRRAVIVPAGLAEQADKLWKEGKFDEVLKLCEEKKKATLAKIIAFAAKHPQTAMVNVSDVAGDIASRDIGHHQMLTYPLAAIGALAPLLGLFGTVLGMIESFETVAIAGSMGDPSLLATGISKALVTTAFGLFVAIPNLFFYNVFRFRTNYLSNLLEEETSTLINEWFMKQEA